MATKTKMRLTAEEFLRKYEDVEGQYELVDGIVVKMQSERLKHTAAKGEAFVALRNAVQKAKLPCRVYTDGTSVKTGKGSVRGPDVAVQCGKREDPESLVLSEPTILVEVISPSSEFRDVHAKMIEYFSIPSVEHYLIVDQAKRVVIHNKRQGKAEFFSRIVHNGTLELDPPGLKVKVANLLGAS